MTINVGFSNDVGALKCEAMESHDVRESRDIRGEKGKRVLEK